MNVRVSNNFIEKTSQIILIIFPILIFFGSAAIETSMSLAVILFLFFSINNRNYQWLSEKWLQYAMLLWGIIAFTSVFMSSSFYESVGNAFPFGRFIIFAAATQFWLFRNPKLLDLVNASIFLMLVLVAISCLMQISIGFDFFGNQPIIQSGHVRLKSFTDKMNVGILLLVIYLPFAANIYAKLRKATTFKMKNLYWLILLLPIFIIYLTGERTALFLSVVGVSTIISLIDKSCKNIMVPVVFFAAVTLGLSFFKSDVVDRQIGRSKHEIMHFSASSYGKIYNAAIEIIDESFIFGHGAKSFENECVMRDFDPEKYRCANHPHNLYLEIMHDSGVVGLSLLLLMLYHLARKLFISFEMYRTSPFALGAFVLFFLKFLPFISSPSIYAAWSMAPAWFMLGLALSIIDAHGKKVVIK